MSRKQPEHYLNRPLRHHSGRSPHHAAILTPHPCHARPRNFTKLPRLNRLGAALIQMTALAVAMAVAGSPFWFQTVGF
ncbi:hypothetical protein CBM2626_U10004 [Cupriavidus taiwanensis]|uniref:Uncharacterized protein n=1 Tax=Cupriavidus taiwanensis TaxID=164546 RepID=A0A375EHG6_9BURK|nr:hypothetical protein CBM2614_U110002 [Cupriavidus taiwanensis]SOZ73740.1 hypothetical protein CBM2615_U20039 [Cupriavidus taiwanensis]SOZ75260.1 hypothetical protein CBM2613_U20005 [Cupriavidus taiwanensis]SPA03743.1 hypothetical protein CBM2626_U10004 [Cupriavidus taiwanensis]SPA12563.1 hypothetical protein CBM2625_U10006 [Cupriavidus taiwanensis]